VAPWLPVMCGVHEWDIRVLSVFHISIKRDFLRFNFEMNKGRPKASPATQNASRKSSGDKERVKRGRDKIYLWFQRIESD